MYLFLFTWTAVWTYYTSYYNIKQYPRDIYFSGPADHP